MSDANDTGNAEEDLPPSEPRESEEGQRQADEGESGALSETDRENRERHPDADAGATDTHGGTEPVGQRETAPQSDFTTRQVGIGVAVLAVGLIIAFALPLLLA
ncbi:hypothetical protein BRC86_02205 [Halobacteriales archaeon QS_3_64_16]|nr:MAG: hypothetical protein BRC86_02205 [Halobacteriales archaeon QS_3_64_16]